MLPIAIKPADRLIKSYYEALGQFDALDTSHEGAVRKAFQDMLSDIRAASNGPSSPNTR